MNLYHISFRETGAQQVQNAYTGSQAQKYLDTEHLPRETPRHPIQTMTFPAGFTCSLRVPWILPSLALHRGSELDGKTGVL